LAQLYVARNAKTILLQCAWQVPVSCIKVKQWDRGFRGIFMYLVPEAKFPLYPCNFPARRTRTTVGPTAWCRSNSAFLLDARRALKSRAQRMAWLNLSAKYWTFPATVENARSYRTVLHDCSRWSFIGLVAALLSWPESYEHRPVVCHCRDSSDLHFDQDGWNFLEVSVKNNLLMKLQN